tara:strand:+ start:487 stop:1140 length:654 start_codon:yes stop_codon:yes gene_type:complete
MLNIKNDLVLLVIASIILGLVIPNEGLLRDYTTEYCNDTFSDPMGRMDSTVDITVASNLGPEYPFYLNKDVGFFSCEIGYIEGYAELTYLLTFPIPFEKEVFILDYSNYIDYLNGEVFGVNNFDLIVEKNTVMNHSLSKETTFLSSNYFFVIDWDYRASYESEVVERPYFLDHDASDNICPTGLDEDYPLAKAYGATTWENSNCIMFNYYLDIDYIT